MIGVPFETCLFVAAPRVLRIDPGKRRFSPLLSVPPQRKRFVEEEGIRPAGSGGMMPDAPE